MAQKANEKVAYLRLNPHIDPDVEARLVNYGFKFYGYKKDKWVIYEKVLTPKVVGKGAKTWEKELEGRMNKIIDAFLDPYAHLDAIRKQIECVAQGLPPEQRLWIDEWVKRNIDSEHYSGEAFDPTRDPPWEDEDHQPALGFC